MIIKDGLSAETDFKLQAENLQSQMTGFGKLFYALSQSMNTFYSGNVDYSEIFADVNYQAIKNTYDNTYNILKQNSEYLQAIITGTQTGTQLELDTIKSNIDKTAGIIAKIKADVGVLISQYKLINITPVDNKNLKYVKSSTNEILENAQKQATANPLVVVGIGIAILRLLKGV